jgi:hypothetical protein
MVGLLKKTSPVVQQMPAQAPDPVPPQQASERKPQIAAAIEHRAGERAIMALKRPIERIDLERFQDTWQQQHQDPPAQVRAESGTRSDDIVPFAENDQILKEDIERSALGILPRATVTVKP